MPHQVIGFHLIITAYGFWLPNDPRGSWSDFVRAWGLLRFGRATKVTTRRSLASEPHDRELRSEAKEALLRPPVEFTGFQAREVAQGFGEYATRNNVSVLACSILPAHVHMVLGSDERDIHQVSRLFKGAATSALSDAGLHPFTDMPTRSGAIPTPWTRHEWVCYLYCPDDVRHPIAYVEENPVKEGKRAQTWSFVRSFDGDAWLHT
jgi:REP element-mobilizing transposase RayT